MKKEQLHINKWFKNKFSTGFSLVELLVSISIFLVFVIAITQVTGDVSIQTKNSTNRERATVLAEEALEATRNIRDAGFTNLVDGDHGLSTVGNQWNFSGTSDVTDIFTRVLNISTISPNQKKANVIITWADQISPTNSLTMSTYFTNWKAILNLGIGLTVNKTVINHGGSKVAADFEPYKIGADTIVLGVANLLADGVYSVTETTDSNYTRTFSGDCDSSGSVTMVSNTTKSCVITNEEKPSRLMVTKVVINHGGSKIASDFTLKVDSNPVVSGVTNIFNSGVHTVSEVVDSGYTGTISGDCDSSGVVTLVPNTTKSCTITNEEIIVNVVPTITNPNYTTITSTQATLGATVTSLGVPATISVRGICYSTFANPSLTNGATCIPSSLSQTVPGVYTVNVSGLIPGTLYYYSGYATNSTGTGYSADGTFTTLGNTGGVCTSGIFTPTKADSSGTLSINVSKPANITQNDLLFAYVGHLNSTDRLNSPSGWTQIGRNRNASANEALFYKIASASEPANYTFTLTSSSRIGVTINAYRGCFNTTTPIDTISNTQYVVNNTTYRAASMTLPSSYTTVIVFPSVVTSGAKSFAAPLTQGGGWNTEYNQGNSSSQFSRSAFSKTITGAGATLDIDSIGTFSGTTQKHSFAVGLKPL